MSPAQLAILQRIIFPVSHQNASAIFQGMDTLSFHDALEMAHMMVIKAPTAALQMGPALFAAVGLYEDN